ncbi:hypothetical protein Sliba_50640 [Streptomyces nigrescens]|uniref:Uncharacterized protein n=1 Tax=Streptomyces nigrescens TaxID=1920 RepID=A0A640TQS2_STRNI|nr:hypothetical protein Sliba_50640 [Streptomyces libani subsp. libani]GGV94808.1 hypothetical protein GCM10010500_33580 [Streptomyces libani subsp. libani]
MPPYSSVSRIRMVGRSQGAGRRGGPGRAVGIGGRAAGAGAREAGAMTLSPEEPTKRALLLIPGQEVYARLILPQVP